MPHVTVPRPTVADAPERPAEADKPCIVTKHLTAFFGNTPAIKDVSLAFPQLVQKDHQLAKLRVMAEAARWAPAPRWN